MPLAECNLRFELPQMTRLAGEVDTLSHGERAAVVERSNQDCSAIDRLHRAAVGLHRASLAELRGEVGKGAIDLVLQQCRRCRGTARATGAGVQQQFVDA